MSHINKFRLHSTVHMFVLVDFITQIVLLNLQSCTSFLLCLIDELGFRSRVRLHCTVSKLRFSLFFNDLILLNILGSCINKFAV